MTKSCNKLLIVVVLSTFFGLAGGAVGTIVTRVFILENAFNVPMFGEINYTNSGRGTQSLVIENVKKVIVEQNDKVQEVNISASKGIVGIFNKIELSETEEDILNTKNSYHLDNEIAQAYAITSDGWLVTKYQPKITKKNLDKFVVITKENEIYEVDEVIQKGTYSFWHINAKDLTVRKFASKSEIKNGQMVLALNWDGKVLLTSVLNSDKDVELVNISSEKKPGIIEIAQLPDNDFGSSFLFNLDGDLIALLDKGGDIDPIYNHISYIDSLLRTEEVEPASLGIKYTDLSRMLDAKGEMLKGALIKRVNPEEAAAIAELAVGDVIKEVDGVVLSKEKALSDIIASYNSGDSAVLTIEREGELKTVEVLLD